MRLDIPLKLSESQKRDRDIMSAWIQQVAEFERTNIMSC